MGLRTSILFAMLIAACDADPAAIDPPPARTVATVLVESGPLPPLPALSLRAELDGLAPIDAGQRVVIKAKIVNVSGEAVPVVAPGDGSSVGWREPHVFFSARRANGGVPELVYSRCGTYDEDWSNEVRTLAPGASLDLTLPSTVDAYFDLQEPGKYEVRVHYRYARGRNSKGAPRSVPASMAEVPAFELASDPVPVEIVRPLEVRLEVTGSLDAGAPKLVDDVLRVVVHNRADVARDVGSPTGSKDPLLDFRVEGDASAPYLHPGEGPTTTHAIAPGESAVVLGKDSVFEPSATPWTVDEAGKFRVQVDYRGIRSNWATVVVR